MTRSTAPLNRRAIIARISATALMGASGFASPSASQSTYSLRDWLVTNAKAVGTIDPLDEDFGDLEPLAAAIGNARVVQLGEPSHNAGSCFAAKARIIKFLHQRLSFEVVIWESGIYDVELVEAALRAGEEPAAAAQRGIMRNWSGSQECRPLFSYAQQSHATTRPIAMAGFDSAMSSPFTNFAAELRTYIASLKRKSLRRQGEKITEALIQSFIPLTSYAEARDALEIELTEILGKAHEDAVARWETEVGAALRPNHQTLTRFEAAQSRAAEFLRAHKTELSNIVGARRSGFMERVVESLAARGADLYERFGTDVTPSTDGGLSMQNRRDACNAENLRWLIEQGYPGRKIVIWAHNAHVMNAYYEAPAWKTIRLSPSPNTMKPHGVFLADWLGRELYTIGFTAYVGEDGWQGIWTSPIPAARVGSIEDEINSLGYAYAFVDLHGGSNELRGPQTMRAPKYDENDIPYPPRLYDGLFFIAHMARATLIPS